MPSLYSSRHQLEYAEKAIIEATIRHAGGKTPAQPEGTGNEAIGSYSGTRIERRSQLDSQKLYVSVAKGNV